MSDIPIGSPPAPPGRHAAPGGWYPDPLDAALERYWDGWQWSRNTRPNEKRPSTAPPAPPYAPPSGPGNGHPNPYGQSGYPPQQGYPAYAPQPQPGQQAAYTADGVRLSGWWWRVLAIVIDGVIVGVVGALIASPIYTAIFGRMSAYFSQALEAAQRGLPAPAQPPVETIVSTTDSLIITAVAVAVETVYLLVFLRWKSATPGKLITGLRVVPVDQGRFVGPLGWNAIIARTVVWVLGGVTAVLYLLRLADGLFPLWHPKRQALHDLAARTQVVKIR